MHNIIFPSKDCTIYSKYPELNTGLDEILEITKEVSSSNYFYRGQWTESVYYKRYDYVSGSGMNSYYYAVAENISQPTSSTSYWIPFNPALSNENSRILIKFDLSNLDVEASASASLVYLNLYTSIARKVPTEYILNIHPMSKDWEMGTGNFTNKLSTDGATWSRSSSVDVWSVSGGDYIAGTVVSQSFNFEPTDIRVNITDIFNYWSSSINNGIIIKRPDEQESNKTKYGSLSFYSLDTHTVYLPTLEVLYDDHVYDTGSFISSSIYQSASFIESSSIIEEVDISGSTIYYTSTSVDYIPVNIVVDGTLLSGSITYTTQSLIVNEVTRSVNNTPYVITNSVIYWTASVSESWINVVSGSMYTSASINYINLSGSFSTLLYTTQSFVSSSVLYTPVNEYTQVSSSLISGSINVYLKNFLHAYPYNEKVRFYLTIKNAYQAKTFYEEARVGETFYLAENSLKYSIKDAYSNRVIIPFSDYTNVSLDSNGHYFDASLSGFMPERFYKIIFKYTENGVDQYIDKNSQFKVVK